MGRVDAQLSDEQIFKRCLQGETQTYDAKYLNWITKDSSTCPREKLVIALASYSEAILRFTETKLYSQHVDVQTLSAHLRKVEHILSINSSIGIAHEMLS